ncbi:hypothetical protein [Roseomonas mucosa]|uniref:hypothetical protein n=1 Tax=Roseomonas mucosa TaxID=207340 RepID=UPI002245A14E|nr:hypothetical protein [Roseomonas mucosa]UZO91733.1 Hypothetical protein RMP42_06016 [Roseomonas mucosa]
MLSIILDLGWYGFGWSSGPYYTVSLGILRLGLSVPALDRLMAQTVKAVRESGAREGAGTRAFLETNFSQHPEVRGGR